MPYTIISVLVTNYSCLLLFLQNGNALVYSSGSRFREERDEDENEFFMLIDIDTENALHVKERPIVAVPQNGSDDQKWKYLTPEPSVRINNVINLFTSILVTNSFSFAKWVST